MITFEKHTLSNGLTVAAHHDGSTPMATVNLLYRVGSRNESPRRTGLAHLFEHLMFGGSVHAPQYDLHVQRAGGECNAFTTADFTSYYITLPAQNVETALWLESDRMMHPLLSHSTLHTQQHVVVEEFNQRYLNQPYGDAQLLLRPLAYRAHPYRWSTIGKAPSHITRTTLREVKDFFQAHYTPSNAILVVGGSVAPKQVFALAQKWFGSIPQGNPPRTALPQEPPQAGARARSVQRRVPAPAIYQAYHMPHRRHPDYHACDLIAEMLAGGKSSRLYRRLVQEQRLFSSVTATVSGDVDPGLITLSAHLLPRTTMPQAARALEHELLQLCTTAATDHELDKVKNKMESLHVFAETTVMQRVIALACAEMMGDFNLVNTDIERYRRVTPADIRRVAAGMFGKEQCSTLYYHTAE